MEMLEVTVLTLNIWGIPFISSDRGIRIEAIATELATGKYDIVALQEVWSQKDSELIQENTSAVLPHTHYFHSGVMGAGLLVLSKYPIISTLFHAWSVNGYFHRVQHADWFGGKGVGLCRILINGEVIHLYTAHLHAEYDIENDDYKTHRVIQAFDTAQFIAATRGQSILQILSGDLNTKPDDIAYNVLLHHSKMQDCCTHDAFATNECHHNSYTSKSALLRNPIGVRIDHIFMRAAKHIEAAVVEYKLPFPDRVPGYKFSYSDHEAVLAKLKLSLKDNSDAARTQMQFAITDDSNINEAQCAASIGSTFANVIASADSDAGTAAAAVLDTCSIQSTVPKHIAVLHEAIALCDSALEQLKLDRIFYYSIAFFLLCLLIVLAEFSVPNGCQTIYLILKLFIFGIILFATFMGSIWNFMERNGILSGKKSMQIILLQAEKKALLQR